MKRALIVIDVQREYFEGGALVVTHPAGSFGNILKAMDAAVAADIPVVVVRHGVLAPDAPVFAVNSATWQLAPEVESRPRALLVDKHLPSSFAGTGLDEWLKKNGVDTVVISGYMTQMCCDTTARYAAHLGYKVEFLSDATGTLAISNDAGSVTAEELHRAILVTQAMRFSKVVATDDWINGLS